MKFRMILSVLLLPTLAAAQQTSVKPVQPYRVIAIQEPVASAQADAAPPATTHRDDKPVLPVPNLILTAPQENGQDYITLLPAGDQIVPVYTPFAPQTQSKVRVSLNLRNAPLKEAVKQLTEQTKLEFVLENDVPADARVTVVAKNIRLSTALDMLTDATDLKWGRQAGKKSNAKEAFAYHIGKNVAQARPTLPWSNDPFFKSPYSAQDFKPNQWNDQHNQFKLHYLELLPKKGSQLKFDVIPHLQWSPKLKLGPANSTLKPLTGALGEGTRILQSKPSDLTTTYTLGNTLITTNSLNEVRSTFTCPHCKQQVTVIHQHQSPKCEKCGRAFHNDWDFCPFDGAKRPANASADWQFCPLCGKSVKTDGKADSKPGN